MWPEQQSPAGQSNSPYPHQGSAPQPPRRPRNRTTVAVVAASAVVVAAVAVTGFLVLGDDSGSDGDKRDDGRNTVGADASAGADGTAAPGGTADDDRSAPEGGSGPLVPGWKTVVNAKRGITFDVPASWSRKNQEWISYVADDEDPDDKPLATMMGPALLEEKWCTSDDDKDGTESHTELAAAGSTGERGAESLDEAAVGTARNWVYGNYTQPDRSRLKSGGAEPYRTKSGLEGSLATVTSSGAPKKGKCDTDGRATTFAFENAEGDYVSWSFVGVHGEPGAVSDATVRKILATVRLYKDGDGTD